MPAQPPICRRPDDAVAFWRRQVACADGFDSSAESFWIVTLDQKRHLVKVIAASVKLCADAARFSEELLSEILLRYAPEIVLIHFRPGSDPKPGKCDIERVRAVILAGRAKRVELLDAVIIGKAAEKDGSDCFCFRQLKDFEDEIPFTDPLNSDSKTEAAK